MKRNSKPLVALASGALFACGVLVQPAHATIISSGTASLADAFGVDTGPEAVTITYAVDLTGGIYTYTYKVNNPTGDVLLTSTGGTTTTPEVVDAYAISFDTLIPGAYISGSQSGGASQQNNGVAGLFWGFSAVSPGNSSATLSFESDDPPTLGNANAQDSNPPSPWNSTPHGQQVPVPQTATVPDGTATAGLLGGILTLLPFGLKRRNR